MPLTDQDIGDLVERWETAKRDRQTLDSTWDEIARLYRPGSRGFVGTRTVGATDQAAGVYDSEQARAAKDLSRAMEAQLFPKSERWAEVTTDGEIEADDDEATRWLDISGKRLFGELYNPRTGFQYCVAQTLGDLPVFGAAAAYLSERPTYDGMLLQPMPLSRVHWMRDYAGRPDTIFCCYELTLRQIRQQWPDAKLPDEAERAWADGKKDTKRQVLRVVLPRQDHKPGSPFPRDMAWAEAAIDVKAKHVYREGGHQENPWLIPEWEVLENGDIWSPARETLPDVLLLQQQAKTLLRTGQRAADPPLFFASDGVMGPTQWSLAPGKINYYDVSALDPSKPPFWQVEYGRNLPITLDMQVAQRRKVGEAFLRYVMMLPPADRTGPQMTATEIMRRNSDFYLLTAAIFGRVEAGFTQPLVEGAFGWMVRRSVLMGWAPGSPLPPPPDALAGGKVEFKFLNPAARAAKSAEVGHMATMLESLLPLFQMKPEALDNLDEDELTRSAIAEITAPKFVRPQDQVDAMREARRQANEEAAQMAQQQGMGQFIKDVTPAGKALIEGRAEAA